MVTRALALRLPAIVVTRDPLADGSVIDICREVKRRTNSPAILLITPDAAGVPDALIAGCDAVLLEPFAPNLLHARIGRLVRLRAAAAVLNAAPRSPRLARVGRRPERVGTNTVCAGLACPQCSQWAPTCFDFSGYRQAWYACLACRHVWLARRCE
jgi:DNA-binding response OmpR family regulator